MHEDDEASRAILARGEGSFQDSRRILVVDDSQDVVDVLADVLREEGHEVFTAYSAEDALDQIAAHRPGVVIIDIGLPGLNGYELAARARANSGSETLRLIALTGRSGVPARKLSSDAGFDAHLVKPIGLDALLDAISDRPASTSTRGPLS